MNPRPDYMDDTTHAQWLVLPSEITEHGFVCVFPALQAQIRAFYAAERIDPRNIWLIPKEALRNAQIHGTREGEVFVYGLFMGQNGICHGIQDPGGFYKRTDVKGSLEAGLVPKGRDFEGPRRHGAESAGYGLGLIIEDSDLIEVDTGWGVLYCVQLRDRIIQPGLGEESGDPK